MENYGWMPCMNCMMMDNMNMQPMMDTEPDMGEEQLKLMYPKIYTKIMPMVKHHCDEHEHMHGTMHCPGHEQIEDMRDKIYKKVENDLDEDFGEEGDDEDYRIRRYGRGNAVRDIIGILLLNELIGRRRRRRRRRPRPRPHYDWY